MGTLLRFIQSCFDVWTVNYRNKFFNMSIAENQKELLEMASEYQLSAVDQVVRILGSKEYSFEKNVSSLVDELRVHKQLALERAKMEVDFQTKLKALEKVKTALADAPDLDIDKQFEEEVRKIDEAEAPSDRDLEITDQVIKNIDNKLSNNGGR